MALNTLNQTIMEQLQVAGKAFLAGVDIDGRFALRSCALHYALTEQHVEIILDAVRQVGVEVAKLLRTAKLRSKQIREMVQETGR